MALPASTYALTPNMNGVRTRVHNDVVEYPGYWQNIIPSLSPPPNDDAGSADVDDCVVVNVRVAGLIQDDAGAVIRSPSWRPS